MSHLSISVVAELLVFTTQERGMVMGNAFHCTGLSVCSYLHRVSKNCANLFLSELRQIYTNFDNIWQKDGKEAPIIRGVPNIHLTYLFLRHHTTMLNADVPKCYRMMNAVVCNKLSNDLVST